MNGIGFFVAIVSFFLLPRHSLVQVQVVNLRGQHVIAGLEDLPRPVGGGASRRGAQVILNDSA